MSKRTIVLDALVPFRHKEDLERMPDEREAFLATLPQMLADPKVKAEWDQLMKDHEADEIRLQVHRQDPERPFVHAKPHLARNLRTDLQKPSPNIQKESEQRSGKSGQLVITVYFPKRGKPRPETELAKNTIDFLTRVEGSRWIQEHCYARGYLTLNACGQEYDDLDSVKHNSLVVLFSVVSTPAGRDLVAEVVKDILIVQAVQQAAGSSAPPPPTETPPPPPAPTISSFSPMSGLAGTSVDIIGTNFSGATAVTFNGISASFSMVSNTEITATVPDGATTGLITVTTPGGPATSAPNNFTVIQPPTITFFSPSNGLAGTSVDILGTNFNGATEVTFNGVSASFSVAPDGASITATVPAGATTGLIQVTTPGGPATSDPSVFTVG